MCFYHRDTFTRNLRNSELLTQLAQNQPSSKISFQKIVQHVTYMQWLCTQDLVNQTVDRILCDEGVKKHISQLKEQYGSVELQFIYKYGLGTIHILRKHLNSTKLNFEFWTFHNQNNLFFNVSFWRIFHALVWVISLHREKHSKSSWKCCGWQKVLT